GRDEGSNYPNQQIVPTATRLNVTIDSIGMAANATPRDLSTLEWFSDGTGGNYSPVNTSDQLKAILSNRMNWLQSTPVVTFEANRLPRDGGVHSIAIRWTRFGNDQSTTLRSSYARERSWGWYAALFVPLLVATVAWAIWRIRKRVPAPTSGESTMP